MGLSATLDKLILCFAVGFFALTADTNGPKIGDFTLTGAALCLIISVLLICFRRLAQKQWIVTRVILSQPIVIAALFYLGCGIASGAVASDQKTFISAVIQRIIIMFLPMFVSIYFPRRPKDVAWMFIAFLVPATFIALAGFADGLRLHFSAPTYVLNLHKNQIGADCSSIILISAAFILTRQFKKLHPVFYACAGCAMLGMLAAQSRAAMLGTVLGIFLMLIALRINLKWLLTGAVTLAGLGWIVYTLLPTKTVSILTSRDRYSSAWIREVSWQYLWQCVTKDPLICVGWGNAIPTISETNLSDGASIFFLDWIQMGITGLMAQFAMVAACIYTPLRNAFKMPPRSVTSAINLAAMGIMTCRFFNAYLDSFWIGRGFTLTTFACAGVVVFVTLWSRRVRAAQATRREFVIRRRQTHGIGIA